MTQCKICFQELSSYRFNHSKYTGALTDDFTISECLACHYSYYYHADQYTAEYLDLGDFTLEFNRDNHSQLQVFQYGQGGKRLLYDEKLSQLTHELVVKWRDKLNYLMVFI